jgi:23S rRNA (adenine2503-C2)-methyltransferase
MSDTTLFGKTPEALATVADEFNRPPFVARQLADWLYVKQVDSIEKMTNLPKALRTALAERYAMGRTSFTAVTESADGVRKYLFPAPDGHTVESAWIPDKERSTLCVSTQTGCRRACRFCATGRAGFHGNLTAGDILNQLASLPERDRVTNMVFMGMGEPLDNVDATLDAVHILTSEHGYAWSPSRITVSTVGILPALDRLLAEARCHVAWSLHTPFADERAALMPVERKYPMHQILETLRRAGAFGGQRRLMIEITLLRGINDSERHARETARILRGLQCRVNLIPFNPSPGIPFEPSSRATLEAYQTTLKDAGWVTTIRQSRGADIAAACGLLAQIDRGDQPEKSRCP